MGDSSARKNAAARQDAAHDPGEGFDGPYDDVFEALFEREEAQNLRIRADLMRALRQLIEEEGWTQEEAARRLGTHQPHVSDLMRGKIGAFSIDRLVNMLAAAGRRVRVHVAT